MIFKIDDIFLIDIVNNFIKEKINGIESGYFVGDALSQIFQGYIGNKTNIDISEISDYDIFITNKDYDIFNLKKEKNIAFADSRLVKDFYINNIPMAAILTQDDYEVWDSYLIDNIDVTYLNFFKKVNYAESILKSLDINSSQILFDIKENSLYITSEYINFINKKIIKIMSLNTPIQTYIRLIYKSYIKKIEFSNINIDYVEEFCFNHLNQINKSMPFETESIRFLNDKYIVFLDSVYKTNKILFQYKKYSE